MDIFSTELNSSPSNINSQLEKEKQPIRHWNVQELVEPGMTGTVSQLHYHNYNITKCLYLKYKS